MLIDVEEIIWSWRETKQFVEHSISFSSDSLHVITGVVVLVGAALLLRKPVSSSRPWLVVLVLSCTNELADLWFERWPSAGIQYGEGIKDLLLTMLLPTLLLLTSRSFPWVFEKNASTRMKR